MELKHQPRVVLLHPPLPTPHGSGGSLWLCAMGIAVITVCETLRLLPCLLSIPARTGLGVSTAQGRDEGPGVTKAGPGTAPSVGNSSELAVREEREAMGGDGKSPLLALAPPLQPLTAHGLAGIN